MIDYNFISKKNQNLNKLFDNYINNLNNIQNYIDI